MEFHLVTKKEEWMAEKKAFYLAEYSALKTGPQMVEKRALSRVDQ